MSDQDRHGKGMKAERGGSVLYRGNVSNFPLRVEASRFRDGPFHREPMQISRGRDHAPRPGCKTNRNFRGAMKRAKRIRRINVKGTQGDPRDCRGLFDKRV